MWGSPSPHFAEMHEEWQRRGGPTWHDDGVAMMRFPLAAELPLPELPLSPFMRMVVGLRQSGFGYKRIARKLGLTRDQARYYARQVRLGGVRGEVPPRRERWATSRVMSCARCGEAIVISQRGRPAKYCSRRCRDAVDYMLRKTRSQQADVAAGTRTRPARGVGRGG